MKAVFFALLFEQSIGTNGGLDVDDILSLIGGSGGSSAGGSEDQVMQLLLSALGGSNAGGRSKVMDLGAKFALPTRKSSSSNNSLEEKLEKIFGLGGSSSKSDHVSIPELGDYSKYIEASDPHAIHWNLNHPAARGGIYMNREKPMDGWEWRDVFHVHAKDGDESWLEDNGLGNLKTEDITSGVREAVHYSKVFRKYLEGMYLKNNGRLNRLLNTSTELQECLDRIWKNGPNEDCHIKNDDFSWWHDNLTKTDGGFETLKDEYKIEVTAETQNSGESNMLGETDNLNDLIDDMKELQEQLGHARQEKALNRLPYAIADDTSGKYPFIDPFLYPDKEIYDRDPFTGEIHLKPYEEDSGEEDILSKLVEALEKSSGGDGFLMSLFGGDQDKSDDYRHSRSRMFGGEQDKSDDLHHYYDDYDGDYYDDYDGDYYYDDDYDGDYYYDEDVHDHHGDHHDDYAFDTWH